MKENYIGKELAQHLHEKGFEGEWELVYEDGKLKAYRNTTLPDNELYSAYTYYQIIVDYSEELFGKPYIKKGHRSYFHPQRYYVAEIIEMLQNKEPQKNIDDYIKDNLVKKYR